MGREEGEGGVAGARDQRRDPFNEPRPRAGSEALNVENVMSGSESARTDAAILDRLYPTLLSRLAQTMRRGRPSPPTLSQKMSEKIWDRKQIVSDYT